MAHPVFRQRYTRYINNAVSQYHEASQINHPGLQGRIREIAVDNLLKPILPPNIRIGTGKIVDSVGNESSEIDLIIYDPSVLPPILYSERDGVFPIEACLYAIEVKSTATATNIRDAIAKTASINQLKYTQAERVNGRIIYHQPTCRSVFFAFSSDLVGSAISELERYRGWDSEPLPRIPALCIVGRGYWFFELNVNAWHQLSATENHDEAIEFLCGVANTISTEIRNRYANRLYPTIGDYLVDIELMTELGRHTVMRFK